MTRRERAQVVELLRCAADRRSLSVADVHPVQGTLGWIAWEAKRALQPSFRYPAPLTEAYRELLLEAAARVEEGWTP